MFGFFPFSFPYFPHWNFHKFPYNSSYFPLPFSTFNFQLLFQKFLQYFQFLYSILFRIFPVLLRFSRLLLRLFPLHLRFTIKLFLISPPIVFRFFPLFFLVFSPNNYRIIPAEYLMAWLYYIVQYIVLYIYIVRPLHLGQDYCQIQLRKVLVVESL